MPLALRLTPNRQDARCIRRWQTIDHYKLSSGKYASAASVTSDSAGNLLVSGNANDSNGSSRCIVRKF